MAKLHIRRTIIFIILGIVGGLIYLAFTPKVYESYVQMVVGNPAGQRANVDPISESVAISMRRSDVRTPLTEMGILRGRSLFVEAMADVANRANDQTMLQNWETYYTMYDVIGERDSDTVVIQARAHTPELAADLGNTIAQKYNESRERSQRTGISTTIANLEKLAEQAQIDVNAAIAKRKAYLIEHSVADLTAQTARREAYRLELQNTLNTNLAGLSAAEQEYQSALESYNRINKRTQGEVTTIRNPTLAGLENQLATLKTQRAQLLSRWLPDSPFAQENADAIRSVESLIAQEKKREFLKQGEVDRPDGTSQQVELQLEQAKIRRDAVRGQADRLQKLLDDQEAALKELPNVEAELVNLNREVTVKDSNLRNIKIQLEDLKGRVEAKPIPGQILFSGQPNPEPVYPNVLIIFLLAVFGGAALGLLYSFAVESLRLRIYTSYQLADLTGLPVVASIPKLPAGGTRQIVSSFTSGTPRILESIRLLAFSLVAQPSEKCRRLLFTGLERNTGTSSSAAQLAISLGQTGSKVILVDADLTGRSSSRAFHCEGQKGLAEALMGEGSVEEIGEWFREAGHPNVKLLPAGVANDFAVKACESKRLEEILNWLSSRADYLILDAPPCLRTSEAARLAADVDEAYLVVSLRLASVPNVSSALDVLRQAGAHVVRLLATEGDRGEEALAREGRAQSGGTPPRALPS